MKIPNNPDFFDSSTATLNEMVEFLTRLPKVGLRELSDNKTVLVIVDMVNGFVRDGALQSPRVAGIIPEVAALAKRCDRLGIAKLVFADCHTESSPEFATYPVHCLAGSVEGEVVNEIKEIGNYKLIPKNSTNGFLEKEFQQWLKDNLQIDNFIITGDCTDICIQQFAITLKTWFNTQNKKVRVVVPVNMVETYDYGIHNGDLMNVIALYSMLSNGIEVVANIEA
jgi:nicotinamidase-related amidase